MGHFARVAETGGNFPMELPALGRSANSQICLHKEGNPSPSLDFASFEQILEPWWNPYHRKGDELGGGVPARRAHLGAQPVQRHQAHIPEAELGDTLEALPEQACCAACDGAH